MTARPVEAPAESAPEGVSWAAQHAKVRTGPELAALEALRWMLDAVAGVPRVPSVAPGVRQ